MRSRRIIRLGLPSFLLLVILASVAIPFGVTLAVEKAFPQTAVGQFEIKVLPPGVLLESASEQSYFSSSNRLFRPLFRYISDRDIAMTTPVEARVESGRMYFWVAADEVHKVDGDTQSVQVIQMPERTVAAIGGRGAYTEQNFNRSRDQLLTWLAQQEQWQASGEPFAVYWNGPFTLPLLKRYEVQVVVAPVIRLP
jgi:hypothetical protein